MPTIDIGGRSRETPAAGRDPRFDQRRARLAEARLYLVCDSRPGGRELSEVLRAAVAGGVDIVQLREKRLAGRELTAVADAACALCRQLGCLFIVNDDPQMALAVGADGVHVGQADTPVARVRELVGSAALVGLSTHTPQEIDAANGAGSDYIGVGPVHTTPTKPGRPAVGLELVRYAATNSTLPFFAIGGLDANNAAAALAAGARRVAVVRAVANAANPERAARALRAQLDAHPLEGAHAPAAR